MDYYIPGVPTGIAWKLHFEINAGCNSWEPSNMFTYFVKVAALLLTLTFRNYIFKYFIVLLGLPLWTGVSCSQLIDE